MSHIYLPFADVTDIEAAARFTASLHSSGAVFKAEVTHDFKLCITLTGF